MTNKKLKLAAMSVALTACVAAQPMAAHAVEGPDANADDTATPQAAPADDDAASSTTPDAADGEEGKQEEFTPPVNEEAKEDEQAPAFGPGTDTGKIDIDYKPAVKPEEPDGSGETGDTGNTGDAGDTDDTKKPDGTYMEGDVIDTSKKDEETGKNGQVIGSATKEETPESSSSTTVVDPDAEEKKTETVGKDEDGNTTITTKTETTGTETTTTTGTGTAKSDTTITDTKEGDQITEDDLKEVLGDWKPTWEIDDKTKLPENVEVVSYDEDKTDSNSKTLILKKTDPTEEKKMSAEDIAKLLDVPEGGVEKKTDDEGNTTYILKKEEISTDEKGNTVTRVTYYEITGNTVKTHTETTLVLKVEKDIANGEENVDTEIKLPSIKDEKGNEILSAGKLKDLLKDQTATNGTYKIEKEENGKTYLYTITENTDKGEKLTNEQLAERLSDIPGYSYKDGKFYYNDVELNDLQINAVRKTLSYDVQVTEITRKPDQVAGDADIDAIEQKAQLDAIKDALTKASEKAGIKVDSKDFQNQLNTITSTADGTFVYTDANGHTFTFNYKREDSILTLEVKRPDIKEVDGKEAENVTQTTVTGTAYVTGGKEEWIGNGKFDGSYTATGSGTIPTIDGDLKSETTVDGVTTKIYEKVTVSEDGKTTTTITYTIIESAADLTPEQKEDLAWRELLKQNPGKTKDELLKAGLTITGMDFSDIKRVEWTINELSETTKTETKDLDDKLVISGGKNWSFDEKTSTITVDGHPYKVTQNPDGSYTCTVETATEKTIYTFTRKPDSSVTLTKGEILNALVGKYGQEYGISDKDITLNEDGKTATFTKNGKTVTVDYSALGEVLSVQTDVRLSFSETTTIETDKDLEAAYEKLWKQIEYAKTNLKPGQTLVIGDLKFTESDEIKKEDIIKYFTKAISPDNMTKDEIIKALEKQAEIAKNSTYVANKGSDYEETKDNYYSGEVETKYYYQTRGGSKIEVVPSDQNGWYYYINDKGEKEYVHWWDVVRQDTRNDIGHLDLASGSKLDLLPDASGKVNQTDCVLVSKDLKLEWNYNAEDLVNGKGNTTVGLDSKISWDDEGGKGDGHYEYDRGDPNNKPDKSAYYKLTGTVAYDPITENGKIKLYQGQRGGYGNPGISAENEAINAYLKASGHGGTYKDLTEEERNAIVGTYVVKIGNTGTNNNGATGYQVYLKTSELTAYGYMTRDANTCINNTYYRQYDNWDYIGGYDLMISKLTQVSDGKVIGQTESLIKTISASLGITSSQDYVNRLLELNKQTTTTHETSEGATHRGENTSGSFSGTYTQNQSRDLLEEGKVTGTGKGHYTTFTEILRKFFSGKGESTYDEGDISYTYRTEDKVTTSAVSKTTETTTEAQVDYNFTTVETRTVTVSGEETVIVPPVDPDTPELPDTPDNPVQDETPDEVVTPETPELPPVQDATPDEVVLPADPELPAVQDATALPQTGVNWFTALGMAFSGMLLMIAGAFTSLKYKEKH